MAGYDDFAWFYNRYWNEDFHSLAFPILEQIWLPRIPSGGRVLDVCSGTGYLAGLLSARGYKVTGIDNSAEMVRYARENVPAAVFHVAGATAFQVDGPFDGAVSTFDSLNHILELRGLKAAFRRTGKALKPGAAFSFDMLLDEAYQTHWGENFAIIEEDHVLTITGARFDFRSRKAQCTITMFRLLAGAWRRADLVVEERCYTHQEIESALRSAGFGELLCYPAADLGMAAGIGEGRVFFVATRL